MQVNKLLLYLFIASEASPNLLNYKLNFDSKNKGYFSMNSNYPEEDQGEKLTTQRSQWRKGFSKSYAGSFIELEFMLDQIDQKRGINSLELSKNSKKNYSEWRKMKTSLHNISKTIPSESTKSTSIFEKLLGMTLTEDDEEIEKLRYMIHKQSSIENNFSEDLTVQKSREFTANFKEFDNKVKRYNKSLINSKKEKIRSISQKNINKYSSYNQDVKALVHINASCKINLKQSHSNYPTINLNPIKNCESEEQINSYNKSQVCNISNTNKPFIPRPNIKKKNDSLSEDAPSLGLKNNNFSVKTLTANTFNTQSNPKPHFMIPNNAILKSPVEILQEKSSVVRFLTPRKKSDSKLTSKKSVEKPFKVFESANKSAGNFVNENKANFNSNISSSLGSTTNKDAKKPIIYNNRFLQESNESDSVIKAKDVNVKLTYNIPKTDPKAQSFQPAHQMRISNVSEQVDFLDIEDIDGITPEQVEYNLREFFKNNPAKMLERVAKGPPSCFRWCAWMIVTGLPEYRDQELFNTYYLCNIKDQTELQIKKDLNRTIPEAIANLLSQKELAEKEFSLYKLLHSFAANDKEVAYCQGMNYIANFLLLISDFNEVDSFYMLLSLFSETFNNNLGIRGFYTQGFQLLNFYTYVFHYFFEERQPKLRKHIIKVLELQDEFWISKWFMTLFTICFPFEVVARIWDCLFSHGLDFLVKFTLAFLSELESRIFKINDTFDLIDFFKTLSPFENESLVNEFTYGICSSNNEISSESFNLTQIIPPDSKIRIEEIIANAIKITLPNSTLQNLKLKYEKENNVNLKILNKKYDLNKTLENLSVDESQLPLQNYLFNNNSNNSKGSKYAKKESSSKSLQKEKISSTDKLNMVKLNSSSSLNQVPKKKDPSKSPKPILDFISNIKEVDDNYYAFHPAKEEDLQSQVDYEDEEVESEIADDIESKIGMYKFNFNNKVQVKSPELTRRKITSQIVNLDLKNEDNEP